MSCPSGGTRHRWPWILVNGGSGVGGSHTPGVPGGGGRETGNNFIKVDFRPSVD